RLIEQCGPPADAVSQLILRHKGFGRNLNRTSGLQAPGPGALVTESNDIVFCGFGQPETPDHRSLLEDFFENCPVCLHIVASDGTIMHANRAELELLGYKAEEYIGHHIAEFHAEKPVVSEILGRLS